jgi:hypothetical protein
MLLQQPDHGILERGFLRHGLFLSEQGQLKAHWQARHIDKSFLFPQCKHIFALICSELQ